MHCCVAKVSSVRFVWSLLRQSSTASIGSHCECLVWRCEATKVLMIFKSSDGYGPGTKFGLVMDNNNKYQHWKFGHFTTSPISLAHTRLPFFPFCGSCWFHLFTSGGEHHCRGIPVSSKTLNPQAETVVGWYPGAQIKLSINSLPNYSPPVGQKYTQPPCGKLHISTPRLPRRSPVKRHTARAFATSQRIGSWRTRWGSAIPTSRCGAQTVFGAFGSGRCSVRDGQIDLNFMDVRMTFR